MQNNYARAAVEINGGTCRLWARFFEYRFDMKDSFAATSSAGFRGAAGGVIRR